MWPAAGGVVLALFVIRLAWAIAFEVAEGTGAPGPRVFEEATGALLSVPAIAVLVLLLRGNSLAGPHPWRAAARVTAGFVPVSIAHTWLLVHLRHLAGPWLGFTQYDLSAGPSRYVYEGMISLVHAIAIVAGFTAAELALNRREREADEARLARALLESELRVLRLRLQPHFLFNALNTISGTMYEDVTAADAQLAHLAELLRAALRSSDAAEVPLGEELATLGHYLALLEARFEDRLDVAVDVPDALRACLVPALLLQPLVENAIRHGALEASGRGTVRVTGTVAGGTLTLRVWDDGPGLPPGRDPLDTGTGLSTTVHRLRLLHGEAQRVTAGNVPGGFAVTIALPERRAAAGVPPQAARVALA
jgi:LytS/YehU family sensor histidine kinase